MRKKRTLMAWKRNRLRCCWVRRKFFRVKYFKILSASSR
uniref:Uncharacterized protein n=1 Tax=Vitis vinifera TaxID=29760 RepID=F6I5H2_VITVI